MAQILSRRDISFHQWYLYVLERYCL
jgi:hypothetical protein